MKNLKTIEEHANYPEAPKDLSLLDTEVADDFKLAAAFYRNVYRTSRFEQLQVVLDEFVKGSKVPKRQQEWAFADLETMLKNFMKDVGYKRPKICR